MTEEQRKIDNKLLAMIQNHFPSLPLANGYTDWDKWLTFARKVYTAGVTEERLACCKLCDDRAKGWNKAPIARDESYAMCEYGAKNEARALSALINERTDPF